MTETSSPFERAGEFLYFLVLSVTLSLMVASFPLGIFTVFFTSLSAPPITNALVISGIGVFVGLYTFILPVSISLGGLFAILTAVYLSMFVYAAKQGKGAARVLWASLTNGFDALYGNPLIVTVMALGATVFLISILDLILSAANLPTGQLTGDSLETFVGVTIAPLREEFGFRVAFIGFAAFLVTVWRTPRVALRALWRPSAIYDGTSGDVTKKIILYIALAVSSIVFGLAHILPGSSWQIGKVPQAALGAAVIGLLYIRYGFHTAVLLHWGVDYFGTVFAFFGQGVWGVPWNSSSGTSLDLFVAFDLVILLGLTSFVLLSYKFLKLRWGGTEGAESADNRSVDTQGTRQEIQSDFSVD